MIPTIEDHHRDAVRYPICACGAVWKQRGNRTGHCTRCHETFEGISLFDRHQRTGVDGRTICTDPADITLGKAETHLEFIDGVWRGPRMDPETIRARFGTTTPSPESRSSTRQADEQGEKTPGGGAGAPEGLDGRTA